jgi:hypothetical protein
MIEWALPTAFDTVERDWNDVRCVVVSAPPDLADAAARAAGAL